MCTVTGMGEATNLALFEVISGLPSSSVRRAAPAMTGMRLSTISPTGGSHWLAALALCGAGRLLLGNPGMLAATVLSDQLAAALGDPARVNVWMIAVAVLALAALAAAGHWWLGRGEPAKKKK